MSATASPWWGRTSEDSGKGQDSGGLWFMVNVSAVGQVFECMICGNVVEVTKVGGGELVCCGEPMVLRK